MKKLMIAAAAVAMVGGAYAVPAVYDFKASVKHMYLKEVRVNIRGGFQGVVYQKYQKSASLKGYLVQDMDGFTSPSITGSAAACADFGRSRSFLVVQNNSAEARLRMPKVLPAVLDAKYLDTRFTRATQSTSGLAEGYLFVGGETLVAVRPQVDMNDVTNVHEDRTILPAPWDRVAPAANTPGIVTYADYVWTSIYLFGQFNGPNWYGQQNLQTPFPLFEEAWDANLPAGLKRVGLDAGPGGTGGVDVDADAAYTAADVYNYYHDTWMNGAGVGKYFVNTIPEAGDLCCGLAPTPAALAPAQLDTLSGNLKGGIFICTENGIAAEGLPLGTYDFFDANKTRWEDQFVAGRITAVGTGLFTANDRWQNDLWQDGAVDQATTDVVYGTWSIKFNRNFFRANNAFQRFATAVANGTVAPAPAANALCTTIQAAAYAINRNVRLWTGAEIYTLTAANRFNVPMLTPQFVAFYGL